MADGEDVEYDSDPEDSLRPSMMRRREASDDEDGNESGGKPVRMERIGIRSDDDLEGEGGAPGYDEDEYDEQEEEEMLEEEAEEEDIEGEDEVEVSVRDVAGEIEGSEVVPEMGGYREKAEEKEEEEGKKANEPFAVPTAGAFYMHDDRFEANGRGRHRY